MTLDQVACVVWPRYLRQSHLAGNGPISMARNADEQAENLSIIKRESQIDVQSQLEVRSQDAISLHGTRE